MNTSQISAKNWTEHEVNSQIAPKIAQTGTTRWPCPATPVPWTTPPTIPPRGEPPASRRQPEHSAATPRSVERMARRKTKTEWGEIARCGEGFQAQISKTAAHDPHYSLLYHLQVGLPRPDADKTAHDRGARPGGTWRIWERSLARSNGHGPAARFGQLVAGHFLDFREIKCQCCNLC